MNNRRVIFVLEPYEVPYGGAAVIYKHVEILNAHGVAAFVALPQKPARDFYNTHAPLLIHRGKLAVRPGDVWVIPEGFRKYMEALEDQPVRRLMFCQNEFYLPFTDDLEPGEHPPAVPGPLGEFGVHGVIASSESVRAFFADVYGLQDVPLIPCAIDPAMFSSTMAKRRQIAYMPRKLPKEAKFIQAVFQRRHGRHAGVTWVSIEGKTRSEAAAIMAQSEVFLSLSHKESLGLPPLEAMACGCLVAGFHGGGGSEYANAQNGWWAENGDWKVCVDGLAAALDLLQSSGEELEVRRRAMAATVERYSPKHMERELLSFWRQELEKPF